MSGFLDTNVLVRYVTGAPADLAEQAYRIIEGEPDLLVTGDMLAETGYVLTSFYQLQRHVVVDALITVLRRSNLRPYSLQKNLVVQGLMLCRDSARVSFADAMIWAAARSSDVRTLYTFDRRFPSDGVTIRQDLDAPPIV